MPAGRPSKYTPEAYVERAAICASSGMTDEETAKVLDIAVSTLYEWKNKYPEFSEALKENKQVVDDRVKNKLLVRATGYEYEEITTEEITLKNKDDEGNTIALPGIKTKITKKQIAPDVTAQIFWLKNRQSLDWRDSKDINVDVNNFSEWVKSLHEQK